MLETEGVSSPEASHLNSVWEWTSCQSSTRGSLGKCLGIHQSAAGLWEGDEAATVYSIWPNTCPVLLKEGARGGDKKMEEQHLLPLEWNPSTKKKNKLAERHSFNFSFILHLLLLSFLLQIYSRCLQKEPPAPSPYPPQLLCLPALGNRRLAEIFLFK